MLQKAAFLAGVFGDGLEVDYPKFLSWATPGPDGLAGFGTRRTGTSSYSRDPAPPQRANAPVGTGEREDTVKDDDAVELKIRTALQRMGQGSGDGVSRALMEFQRMDPGGRRGEVFEHELVEVRNSGRCGEFVGGSHVKGQGMV